MGEGILAVFTLVRVSGYICGQRAWNIHRSVAQKMSQVRRNFYEQLDSYLDYSKQAAIMATLKRTVLLAHWGKMPKLFQSLQ